MTRCVLALTLALAGGALAADDPVAILGEIEAVPSLRRYAADEWDRNRRGAAIALGDLGRRARPAAASLADMLDDPSGDVRRAGARALIEMGAAAVPVTLPALGHRKVRTRLLACKVLGGLGAEGAGAVSALRQRMRDDPKKNVRMAAFRALGKIQGARWWSPPDG